MGKQKSANEIRNNKAKKRASKKRKYAKQHKEKLRAKMNQRRDFIEQLQNEYVKEMVKRYEESQKEN